MQLSPEVSQRMKAIFRFDREPRDTEQLIEQFARRWLKLPDDLRQVMSSLFRHFMTYGRWPDLDELSQQLEARSVSDVKESVNRAIQIGYVQTDPETSRYSTCLWVGSDPTMHQVEVKDGVRIYAGCALDGLWVFNFTSEDGRLRSACPHCGQSQMVEFKQGAIIKWEPADMQLFVGTKLGGTGSTGELCCPFINLFPDPQHLQAWLPKVPDVAGAVLTREQTERLARVVVSPQKWAKLELA